MREPAESHLIPQSSGEDIWVQEYCGETGQPVQFWPLSRLEMFNLGLACLAIAVDTGLQMADFTEEVEEGEPILQDTEEDNVIPLK